MSWRLNWYKVDKTQPIFITHREEYNDGEQPSYEEWDSLNGEMIIWSEGTEVWIDMTEDERNNKDLFIELKKDEDEDIFEVTKEGLALFIEKYRQIIVKAYEEGMKSEEEREWNWPSLEEYDKQKYREWKSNLVYDLKTDSKYEIATSWKYEYTIFNLIALYKNFDFEHYKLVINGG